MAQPKKKLSSSRSDRRRSHLGLAVRPFAHCSNCRQPVIPHTVCSNCGFYKGVSVTRPAAQASSSKE